MYYKLQTEYEKAMKRRVAQEDIPETQRIRWERSDEILK
jgi:hypothetical protein